MQAAEQIQRANARYHDLAASGYDAKWGIGYDRGGQAQVVGKLRKALGSEPARFARALEVGAGTGYFTLNLMRAGIVERAVASDISPGHARGARRVCRAARARRRDLLLRGCRAALRGRQLRPRRGTRGAASPPGSRRRVLRVSACAASGRRGRFLRRAVALRRPARRAAEARRLCAGAAVASPDPRPPAQPRHHACHGRGGASRAGGRRARLHTRRAVCPSARGGLRGRAALGEELAASLFGWANRALEATAAPEDVPRAWREYAYRGYLLLQVLDRSLLEPRLPPALFYNLLVSARAPA